MKIIFIGTPEFGIPTLQALNSSADFKIIAVISQPDKKIGRTQKITATPIKKIAKELGLKVYQPDKIRNFVSEIQDLNPDLIIVAAYGQIIPESILSIPKFGCLNIHGSLLPLYRGAGCLAAPIINGDKETGITLMKMDKGLDTGDILKQFKIKLEPNDNLETVHDRLSKLSGETIIDALQKYLAGQLPAQKQDDARATYVKTFQKEDGHLDFSKPALEIERLIRALNPWPGTFGYLDVPDLKINHSLVKILGVRPVPIKTSKYQPGELFIDNKALGVQCGDEALIITKLQIAGRKVMETDEFLRGNKSIIGQVLK